MPQLLEVYKCEKCGLMIEIVHSGKGHPACCHQPMLLLVENTTDAALEKHVPVIERTADGIAIKVGSVEHPMLEEHFIEWIELIADGKIYRQHFKPGDKPETFFRIHAEKVVAREYCNLHGLWKAE